MTTEPMKRKELKALIGIADGELVVHCPFDLGEVILPPLAGDEFDLLTEPKLRGICQLIVDGFMNGGLAATGFGIPSNTMREYLEVGAADLASGIPTRKAVAARYVFMAEGAVMVGLVEAILERPHGWGNYSFILERVFPEFFSAKRDTRRESKQSSQMEALQRQLSGAMAYSQAPQARVKPAEVETSPQLSRE